MMELREFLLERRTCDAGEAAEFCREEPLAMLVNDVAVFVRLSGNVEKQRAAVLIFMDVRSQRTFTTVESASLCNNSHSKRYF